MPHMYKQSSHYNYSDLKCNPFNSVPVEHLFKSIFIMQYTDDLAKECDRLKKKLHKLLIKHTQEEDGFRQYGIVRYHPNGYCSFGTSTRSSGGLHEFYILLEGYESSYAPPEIDHPLLAQENIHTPFKQKRSNPHTLDRYLREDHMIWYAQLRFHIQKPNFKSEKYDLLYLQKTVETLSPLSTEEMAIIPNCEGLLKKTAYIMNNVHSLFSSHFPRHMIRDTIEFKCTNTRFDGYLTHYFRPSKAFEAQYLGKWRQVELPGLKFPFLMADELDCLNTILTNHNTVYTSTPHVYYYKVHNAFYAAMDEFYRTFKIDRPGRVFIDLSSLGTYQKDLSRFSYQPYGSEWSFDYEYFAPNFILQTSKIKDPTIIRVLKKFGLWHPDLFPQEDLSEEEPESDVEIIEPDASPVRPSISSPTIILEA